MIACWSAGHRAGAADLVLLAGPRPGIPGRPGPAGTKVLAARPVWLFSSGPLGTGPADAKGRDLRTVTVPKEIPEFTEALHPRGHHVFFGALDPGKLTFAERSLRKLPAARAALPGGDFRDWPEIDDWAAGIARELATAP